MAAGYIVYESFHQIVIPHQPPQAWTLLVLVIIIVVKEGLFRFVNRGAQQFDSDAARADAWHHRSDAITSLAALIGSAWLSMVQRCLAGRRWSWQMRWLLFWPVA